MTKYYIYKLCTPLRIIQNTILGWRYPWLKVRDWKTGKICRTSIWTSPHDGGWNRAFFFPMMERIRKAAKEEGTLKTLVTDDYKSKYGGLRFYTSGGGRKVNEIISEYECLSQYICETCGEPDVGYTKGWIMPICKTCYERCCSDTRPYEEAVGKGRMPDYYRFRRFEPGEEETKEYAIDIRDKADEIRMKWNHRHPFRRKEYAKY